MDLMVQNIPLVKENGNSCIIQIISEDSLKKFYLFKDGFYSFFLTYELFYFLVIIMKNMQRQSLDKDCETFSLIQLQAFRNKKSNLRRLLFLYHRTIFISLTPARFLTSMRVAILS